MQTDLFTEEVPIDEMIERGALFVCNHSGGKDSQAMYLYLRERVPAHQLVVVHAHLPEVEWDGVVEHIHDTIYSPYYECQAGKTFLQMVEARGMWPGVQHRQCTSDLKRGPLEKLIRGILKKRNLTLVVNCMGMRAQESPNRKKKPAWKTSSKNSVAGREWYEWLPIHAWTEGDVFRFIEQHGQQPHWAYKAGMSRLSCCFCIMASDSDLRTAAGLRPALFQKYIALEEKIGHTFRMPKGGEDVSLKRYANDKAAIQV
jgi:DNA sulfur modification protein DndC